MVGRNGLAEGLREFGLAALGFTLMLSLLAIWVAWTGTMLLVIFATTATAGVLFCALYGFHASLQKDHVKHPVPKRTQILPDRFVAEVHGLFPMIHHNRRLGDQVFQRTMDRLKSLMNDPDDAGSENILPEKKGIKN